MENMMTGVADLITSHAMETGQTWPNVILPDFQVFKNHLFDWTPLDVFFFEPIVKTEEKNSWESFALSNVDHSIYGSIYTIEGNAIVNVTEGPFAPIWDIDPSPKPVKDDFLLASLINLDVMSKEYHRVVLESVQEVRRPVISAELPHEDFLLNVVQHAIIHDTEQAHSAIMYPVFATADEDAEVIGVLHGLINWQSLFLGVLDDKNTGLYCVIRDTCGDLFTCKLEN